MSHAASEALDESEKKYVYFAKLGMDQVFQSLLIKKNDLNVVHSCDRLCKKLSPSYFIQQVLKNTYQSKILA